MTREELERKIKADPRFTLVRRPGAGVILAAPVKVEALSASLPPRENSPNLKKR